MSIPYYRVMVFLLLSLFLVVPISAEKNWYQVSDGPVETDGMACAYDTTRNTCIMFGGEVLSGSGTSMSGNTYEWTGSKWRIVSNTGPNPRASSWMEYDSRRDSVILFGGWTQPDYYFGDTWRWKDEVWTQLSPSTSPSPRANFAMAYDRARGKILIFGGSYYQTIFRETWEWDGSNWRKLSDTGPSARIFPFMVYDDSRGKIVLFGGQSTYGGQLFGDTWEWGGSSWNLVAAEGPSGRSMHRMAYDPTSRRVVLFGGGGHSNTISFEDMWEWGGSTWSQLKPDDTPAPRVAPCMFFDRIDNTITLFGGKYWERGGRIFKDVWKYGDPPATAGNVAQASSTAASPTPPIQSPDGSGWLTGNLFIIGFTLCVALLLGAGIPYYLTKRKKGASTGALVREGPSLHAPRGIDMPESSPAQNRPYSHHDVFISYPSYDKAVADGVCATLEAKKIKCWIAPRDILAGTNYAESLIHAIDTSKIMVLVFSSRSNQSPHILREVERAVNKNLIIIPFRIENVLPSDSLQYYIGTPHWLDALTPPLEKHLEKLSETVLILLKQIENSERK